MAPLSLRAVKSVVNRSLAPIGIKIVGVADHDWSDPANFIPFQQTMERMSAAKMSVGDYVDAVMNGVPGSSQSTIDKMACSGVFSGGCRRSLR
jgi:hypothetical protein